MSINFSFPREGVPQGERQKYGVGKRLESVGTVVGNRDCREEWRCWVWLWDGNLKAAGWGGGDEESGDQIVGRKISRGGGKCSSRNRDGETRSVDGKMEIGRSWRREADVGMRGMERSVEGMIRGDGGAAFWRRRRRPEAAATAASAAVAGRQHIDN